MTKLFYVVSAVLVFVAFTLSAGGETLFIPYLLFMLAGQATTTFPTHGAIRYSAALVLIFAALLWAWGEALVHILSDVMTISMGMVFVTLFTIIAVRYGQQTARAEALLTGAGAAVDLMNA